MSIASEIYAKVMAERIDKVVDAELQRWSIKVGGVSARVFELSVQAERVFDKCMNELADEKLRR